MRRLYLLLVLFLVIMTPAWSQVITITPFTQQRWYLQRLPAQDASLLKLPGGGFFVIGVHSVSNTSSALSVVRTTMAGDTLWTKWRPLRFPANNVSNPNQIKLFALRGALDQQGNAVLSMGSRLIKLDAAGDTVWTRPIGPEPVASNSISAPVVALDGNYVVAYNSVSPVTQQQELRVAKIDQKNGQTVWNQSVSSLIPNTYASPSVVALTKRQGGYFLLISGSVGLANVPAAALVSEAGTATFQLLPTGEDYPSFAFATADGGVLVFHDGGPVSKVTAAGNVTWTNKQYNVRNAGPYSTNTNAVAEDAQGNVVLVGAAYFPAGPGRGTSVSVLERYSASGVFLDSHFITPTRPNENPFAPGRYTSLTIDAAGDYSIGGFATVTAPAHNAELTLAKQAAYAPLSQRGSKQQAPLQFFPNPAGSTTVQVQLPTSCSRGELTVTDALGRVKWQQSVTASTGSFVVPVGQLAAGLYLLYLIDGQATTHVARLVRP